MPTALLPFHSFLPFPLELPTFAPAHGQWAVCLSLSSQVQSFKSTLFICLFVCLYACERFAPSISVHRGMPVASRD